MIAAAVIVACAQAQAPAQTPSTAGTPAPAAESPVHHGYPAQDALSYAVEVRVDFESERVQGRCRYRIRALEPLNALRLDLRADDAWTVEFFDAEGAPLEVRRSAHQVVVPLAEALAAGEVWSGEARFRGRPTHGLSFAESRYGETFLVQDPFAVRTRGWLPCEDFVGDRARFTLVLEVPASMEAIGAGAWSELSAEPAGAAATRSYRGETRSDVPPTLFAFAAGPFVRVPEAGDERLVPHFVYARDRRKAEEALVHHAEWMAIMEETFGPYSYAKYTTAQVPTRWGGVEYPGNVWLAESLFDAGGRGVGTLAHEFAHMWFGDGVGYAHWRDAWLSEGFANYFGPWLQEHTGGLPMESVMGLRRQAWRRAQRAHALPVVWEDWKQPDDQFLVNGANVYGKGAWVLHMLRAEVGEEAFFGGLAAWYRAHRGGVVTSDDLRAAMEEASGEDLEWFFDQWLRRPGAPRLRFTPEEDAVVVEQTQEGDPFRFPLRLGWTDADGEARTRVFPVRQRSERLVLGAGWSALRPDPRTELLHLRARD